MTELGKYLTKRIADLQITQSLFATQCAIDEAALSRYLRQDKVPTREIIARIMNAVGDGDQQRLCLHAYLRDVCPEGYEDMIRNGGPVPAVRAPATESSPIILALRHSTLSGKMHQALAALIRAMPHNKILADTTLNLGLLAMQDLQAPSLNEKPISIRSPKGTQSVSYRRRRKR